jgi:hypothetical protein
MEKKNRIVSLDEYINEVNSLRIQSLQKDRICMAPGCKCNAIQSHVFQKSSILSAISENGKLYQLDYDQYKSPQCGYNLINISNTRFTFKGFCNKDDTDIFASIEQQPEKTDWNKIRPQYLMAYKSLCRELFIVNVGIDYFNSINRKYYLLSEIELDNAIRKSELYSVLSTMQPYKLILENGIFNNDYSKYCFETITLPFQLDLCLSAPISFDVRWSDTLQEVNIVNVFPFYGKTIIILGYNPELDGAWYQRTKAYLHSDDPHYISEGLVDIMYRAEFHCISPNLYRKIEKDIPAFLKDWYANINNFDAIIEKDLNILYNPICELMTA